VPETPKPQPKEPEKKLSFQERKEFQKLEKEIQDLEKEKSEIESALSGGRLSPDEVRDQSERYGELVQLLDEKTMIWLEMAERA
jgi:ATP-binding cassette subfamily F protein uup